MATILSLKGVSKVWRVERSGEEVVALRCIDLEVQAGEFLVFLGPSGCGKSTLLQIISELEEPSSGVISFARAGQAGLAVDGRKKPSCTVFQEYALFPWRTVIDNIAFGPEVRKVSKGVRYAEARRYLRLVNLQGFEHRYPSELSGGMKQRVALARALANDPEILLLDEPLASLDAQTRRVLQEELVRIWTQTNRTFIYVTHSLEEAVLLGDRILLMTARPGQVKELIPVNIPRPRSTTGDQEVKVLRYLAEQIREEVERSMRLEERWQQET